MVECLHKLVHISMDLIKVIYILLNVYFCHVIGSQFDQCFNNSEYCEQNKTNYSNFFEEIEFVIDDDHKISNQEIDLINLLGPKILSYEKPFELSSIEGLSSDCERDYKYFLDSLKKFEFWALKSELNKLT